MIIDPREVVESHQQDEWDIMGGKEMGVILMSLVAGLSTGLGGAVIFCVHTVSARFMAFTLGLAAGVMTSVSVLELLPPIMDGSASPVLWGLIGVAAYAWLRRCLPEPQTSGNSAGQWRTAAEERAGQWRLGILMMLTLTAHNLPEGVAVAVGAMSSPRTGVVVMAAIAMHNIPEGLAIAVPIYAATGDRTKALAMTLASGLSEPVGAGLGVLLLRPFLSQAVVDNATCAVGGVMTAVSFFELIPESRKHGDPRATLLGALFGWLIILVTVRFA